jgi:hypothetical protein
MRVDARRARRRRDAIDRTSTDAVTERADRDRTRRRVRVERIDRGSNASRSLSIVGKFIHSRIDDDVESRANDGDDVLDRANRSFDERVSRVVRVIVVAGETHRARRGAR